MGIFFSLKTQYCNGGNFIHGNNSKYAEIKCYLLLSTFILINPPVQRDILIWKYHENIQKLCH